MKLYHGGKYENLKTIIDTGEYAPGNNNNAWSGTCDDGLFCSNVKEYAMQYSDCVIEIDISENNVEHVQECPKAPDCVFCEIGCKECAHEYMIPVGTRFKAYWA